MLVVKIVMANHKKNDLPLRRMAHAVRVHSTR